VQSAIYDFLVFAGFNIGSASTGGSQNQTNTNTATTGGPASTPSGTGPAAAATKPLPSSSSRRDVNQDVCNVPGFTVLQWLLSQHPRVPHVYFMMMALLVGQPVQQLPQHVQVASINQSISQSVIKFFRVA